MILLFIMTGLMVLAYPFVELGTFAILAAVTFQEFRFTSARRIVCGFGLVIGPACLLMLANDTFWYPWNESAMLLVWIVVGGGVLISLFSRRRLYTSGLNFLSIIVLAGICLCYVVRMTSAGHPILAVVPLMPLVNLLLLARHVWCCGELNLNPISRFSTIMHGKEPDMNAQRFTAIAFIFAAASIGWTILGNTIDYRTDQLEQSLSEEVDTMWGPAGIVQCTPCVLTGGITEMDRGEYDTPIQSDVEVNFEHHNRYKGLLWFSTYTVKFSGTYRLGGPEKDATFLFKVPDDVHSLEEMTFTVNDVVVEPVDSTRYGVSNTLEVPISAGAESIVEVKYTTRARDRWAYSSQWHTAVRPGLLRNFTLMASTDFADIDYPKGSVSPTAPADKTDGGTVAKWQYKSMRANQTMGIEMPARTNAGPIAARMSFFAPVSLAFFFTVLFTVVVLKKLPLHPMHYLFISAGFFAFHILMAYLVDLIPIHAAFWVCAAVSTALVVSYMRLVAGVKFAVIYVGAAQVVYLVGFSYAFFWVGVTGLALTVGAIATLFVLMQATGKIDWYEVFRRAPVKSDQWVTVPPLPDEARAAPEPPDASDNE
ncbi:MAG: inner membrane CreD family protein [Phycisphaerae bacterium]|jgi:hypothetical protein|nr:inner membrane CreD family protein [Phycisphaerae bacterium]